MVLSDMKDDTETILKSAVGLANMIQGDIELFCVKEPSEVIKGDNQLSAMHSLKEAYKVTRRKVQETIAPIAKENGVQINFSFSIGNVKREIGNHLKAHKPDVIIMGKRDSKPIGFFGDSLSQFVLNSFDGTIMFVSRENAFEPSNKLSIGMLNGIKKPSTIAFFEDIVLHAKEPLKSFNIVDSSKNSDMKMSSGNKETVDFVFEKDENSVSNLANYLQKNNIDLLFVERGYKEDNSKVDLIASNLKEVISNLKVSLLFSGTQKLTLQ